MHIRARRWKRNLRRQDSYILVLDNPRTAVYNKDKERRWLHSGQLPFWMSDFIRKNDRSGWEVWGGHFSCHFLE